MRIRHSSHCFSNRSRRSRRAAQPVARRLRHHVARIVGARHGISQSAMNARSCDRRGGISSDVDDGNRNHHQRAAANTGYLSMVLMPLVMTGIANGSSVTNATVSTAVTRPMCCPTRSPRSSSMWARMVLVANPRRSRPLASL